MSWLRPLVAAGVALTLVGLAAAASAHDRGRQEGLPHPVFSQNPGNHFGWDHGRPDRPGIGKLEGPGRPDRPGRPGPAIPEPTSALAFGAGLLAVTAATRRRESA